MNDDITARSVAPNQPSRRIPVQSLPPVQKKSGGAASLSDATLATMLADYKERIDQYAWSFENTLAIGSKQHAEKLASMTKILGQLQVETRRRAMLEKVRGTAKGNDTNTSI